MLFCYKGWTTVTQSCRIKWNLLLLWTHALCSVPVRRKRWVLHVSPQQRQFILKSTGSDWHDSWRWINKQCAPPTEVQPSTTGNKRKRHQVLDAVSTVGEDEHFNEWLMTYVLPVLRAWLLFVPESEYVSPNTEPSVYFLSFCPALTLNICFLDHFNCLSVSQSVCILAERC